jgi:hypothetical protein
MHLRTPIDRFNLRIRVRREIYELLWNCERGDYHGICLIRYPIHWSIHWFFQIQNRLISPCWMIKCQMLTGSAIFDVVSRKRLENVFRNFSNLLISMSSIISGNVLVSDEKSRDFPRTARLENPYLSRLDLLHRREKSKTMKWRIRSKSRETFHRNPK